MKSLPVSVWPRAYYVHISICVYICLCLGCQPFKVVNLILKFVVSLSLFHALFFSLSVCMCICGYLFSIICIIRVYECKHKMHACPCIWYMWILYVLVLTHQHIHYYQCSSNNNNNNQPLYSHWILHQLDGNISQQEQVSRISSSPQRLTSSGRCLSPRGHHTSWGAVSRDHVSVNRCFCCCRWTVPSSLSFTEFQTRWGSSGFR